MQAPVIRPKSINRYNSFDIETAENQSKKIELGATKIEAPGGKLSCGTEDASLNPG